MKKFTFKTTKPTGKYRCFHKPYHDIKIKGQTIGNIDHETFKIRLMVIKSDINEDGNPNCTWKWITLSKKSNSIQEAKDFLNEDFVIKTIFEKYKFPLIEALTNN